MLKKNGTNLAAVHEPDPVPYIPKKHCLQRSLDMVFVFSLDSVPVLQQHILYT